MDTICWYRVLFIAVLVLSCTGAVDGQVVGRGDLSDGERIYLREMIGTYRSPDLARIWIAERLRGASSKARADLEYSLADCLRSEGDIDGYDAKIQALARKYPSHLRSKGAELEAVQAAMARSIQAHNGAVFETDARLRTRMLAERDSIYRDEVASVLDSTIFKLNEELEQRADAAKESQRDAWEYYRLQALRLYAQRLPEGSAAARTVWERLVELSSNFVETRYENFVRRYEAQLFKGQALAALGRSEEAAEELELVVEIEPTIDPPYNDATVYVIRWLRIQALAGTAEAWNRAGKPEEAVDLFDFVQGGDDEYFPWKKSPEDPRLEPFIVQMEVEEAISRIAGGIRGDGLKLTRRLIDRYRSTEVMSANPDLARSANADIARGMSRLVDMKIGGMPAEFYFLATQGYKKRAEPEKAILAGKLVLNAGSGDPGANRWCSEALYEIAENSDALGRSDEAALAYQQLVEGYPDGPRVAAAAQNFFAISGDLAGKEIGGGPWQQLLVEAEGFFAEHSKGLGSAQLRMQQGAEAEGEGRYSAARELYLAISKTISIDGEERPVPFFYRARAAAARCLARLGEDPEIAASQALGELEPLIESARTEGDAAGEAVLRFELAVASWNDRFKQADLAISALSPLLEEVGGSGTHREGGLLLWLQILCAEGRLEEAERVFSSLDSDFPDSQALLIGTYDLVVALQVAAGDPSEGAAAAAAARRAGDLISRWIQLPGSGFEDAEAGVKFGIASILIDGGRYSEAVQILERTRATIAEDDRPEMQIAISFYLAKAANASGQHDRALESLDALVAEFENETFMGQFNDAPYLLIQRALANRGLYKSDRNIERLESMEKDLNAAIGILGQRRRSLRLQNALTPSFDGDYWNTWLLYLDVLKAQNRCEDVLRIIKSRRLMHGSKDSDFAPRAQQVAFDRIEKECQ